MSKETPTALPFLLRFGEKLGPQTDVRSRHDHVRQVNEVEVGGVWVDAVDTNMVLEVGTKITDVNRETTDDN
jgi:hypothetical protein